MSYYSGKSDIAAIAYFSVTSVSARSSLTLETSGAGAAVTVGSARVIPDTNDTEQGF